MGSERPFAYPDDGEGPPVEIELAASGSTPVRSRTPTSPTSSPTPATSPRRSASAGPSCSPGCSRTTSRRRRPWAGAVVAARWRARTGGARRGRTRPSTHGRPSGRPRLLERRRRVRGLGRKAARHRGGVGARGAGRSRARRSFPWGDELEPDGEHRMNVWQGDVSAPQLDRRTDTSARHPSSRSRPTGSASTR